MADFIFKPSGRGQAPIEFEIARELQPEDLQILSSAAKPVVAIQKLRDHHHAVARAVARGLSDIQVSAATGYTPQRIRMLKDDPAFAELVAFYRANDIADEADLHHRLAKLSFQAAELLSEKLENGTADDFSVVELDTVIKTTSDRTGHGTKTTHEVNITAFEGMSAAELREYLRKESVALGIAGPIIDAEVIPDGD